MKDYISFHTKTEKLVVCKRMKKLEEILSANFLRIHNPYIINTNHVKKVEGNHLYAGVERIPIN